MDFPLCNIMDALEQWITFQETGQPGELYELAIWCIDWVDFAIEVSDDNDMLAAPEIAAKYERIRRALTR
ncbi:hypothetical protein ACQEVZ_40930 [Dactylosporangium sp. CA-152071]|uniref:hypothetical protein n=1 Tax=Dactylosporangium sp. CA-152071 TaxID=3239933 RepID=UPI003D914C69